MSDAKAKDYEHLGPVVVICFVAVPVDDQQSLARIRDAVFASLGSGSFPPAPEVARTPTEPDDPWLNHPEAAKYLKVSESTLYKYASQHRLECRKLGGRLEYRLSSLDRFRDRQIRPARPSIAPGRIMPAAPSSGK